MTSSGPEGAPVRTRTSSFVRVAAFVVAVGLGGTAGYLIVTSTTQRHLEIGVLVGLWGLLIGAYSAFGSRPHAAVAGDPGTALELRSAAALARADDVAAQHAFQARLEAILRREVQQGVARELVGLREEVSSLRSEILEKVGGQLRMERTETTRLFGSGLEELQREVRQLKVRQFSEPDVIVSRPVPVAETIDAEEVDVVEVVSPARGPVSVQKPAANESDGAGRTMRPASAFETVAKRDSDEPVSSMPPPSPLHTWPPMRSTPVTQVPAAAAPQPTPQPTPTTTPAPTLAPLPIPQPTAQPIASPLPQPFAAAPAPAAAAAPVPPPPVVEPAPAPVEPTPLPRFELPPVPRIEVPTVPRFDPASFAPAVDPVTPIPGIDNADIFASMPRIKPFTDFELEPVDRAPVPDPEPEPQDEAVETRVAGRHSTPEGESGGSRSGGRRHRSDDAGNDMLARILERERR